MSVVNQRMVADVGGTNTRVALYDPAAGDFRALRLFANRDYRQFEDVIADWLENLDEPAPVDACVAVAAAPSEDQVTMFNRDWSFSCTQLAADFGFSHFNWINDFTAIANALPFLLDEDRHTFHTGDGRSTGKLAAVGPGTGLGGATIEQIAGELHVSACEPGHMGLSPGSELELELFRLLSPRHDSIYTELLVSGPGLQRLYQGICELRGSAAVATTPAEVSAAALAGDNKASVEALELFCALLGSACGDFVLANGAYGGLYLAGGIIPGLIPFLAASDFHRRFCNKGAMSKHLNAVPIHIITAGQPGLIGAAHAVL
jgi:glucokinase